MSNLPPVRSIVALLEGLVDYAGLFPPAGLGMAEAVECFARYAQSADGWMLGRFVVSAARLDELVDALRALPVLRTPRAWPVSLVVTPGSLPDLHAIDRRLAALRPAWPIEIGSIECPVSTPSDLAAISRQFPGDIEVFGEVPLALPVGPFVEGAVAASCGLKLRTGGTSTEAFPAIETVASFLVAAVRERVCFKATAGLHHPVRSVHGVTYDPGAARTTMHGFVNLFMAATLAAVGAIDNSEIPDVLAENDPAAFEFSRDRAAWRGCRIDTSQVKAARMLARSFGSCSFEEPVHDLRHLGWLPTASTVSAG